MDPVPASDVVGRRHHPAPVRVAADHERPLAQLGRLQFLHGGEERVQVEMRDDHGSSRYTVRIGTPNLCATKGIVAPWTMTEKATTTKTIP